MSDTCPRCFVPRSVLNGMTPWDYFHDCANLGKYGHEVYSCACDWLDQSSAVSPSDDSAEHASGLGAPLPGGPGAQLDEGRA